MTRAKWSAFLLGLASVAGILLAITFAVIPAPFKPAPPLGLLSPASLGVLLFLCMAPVVLLPGCISLSLWLVVVRAQEEKERRQSEERPAREEVFQAHLGASAQALLAGQELSALPASGAWDEAQHRRFALFEFGSRAAEGPAALPPTRGKSAFSTDWITRWLVLVLFVSGSFLILWGVGVFLTFLWTDVPKYFGFEPGLTIALFGSSKCFALGASGVLGGIVLQSLARREAKRRRQLSELERRAGTIAQDGFQKIAEKLLSDARMPDRAATVARAALIASLPELDGAARGQVLLWLHARRLLPKLDLHRLDLRGSVLEEADFSGACLAGADLSGALFRAADLSQADLSGCLLYGADLRDVQAGEVNFKHVDLRHAQMQRISLPGADLGAADLTGANLYLADLKDADLTGTLGMAPSRPFR